jgi:Lon protease-like protein
MDVMEPDDDLDLRDVTNLTRLFPLPRVVLFPHAVLPLHIFEPRYRQMTRDALGGDHLVTVVQLRPPTAPSADALGSPPVENVGCLGRIIRHECLPDGRFNFLLLGRKRVRLTREVPSDRLYRVAEVEVLDDLGGPDPQGPVRAELKALFRRVLERQNALDPDLAGVLEGELPLGVLTDIVAHALGLPAEVKQGLLADPRVDRRAAFLRSLLQRTLGGDPDETPPVPMFPPPFSTN